MGPTMERGHSEGGSGVRKCRMFRGVKSSGRNLGPFHGKGTGAGRYGRHPSNPTGRLREKLEQKEEKGWRWCSGGWV